MTAVRLTLTALLIAFSHPETGPATTTVLVLIVGGYEMALHQLRILHRKEYAGMARSLREAFERYEK